MQNDKNKSNSRSSRFPSVEETTAAVTAEQEREEAVDSLSQSDKPEPRIATLGQNKNAAKRE